MVITPIEFGRFVDRPMRPAIEGDDFSSGIYSLTNQSTFRSPDRALISMDFAAKLDEMLEQIKLDGERLLMYGDAPKETEDQESATSQQSSVDFTTYQMVLEAGQKRITQSGLLPDSDLRLFA